MVKPISDYTESELIKKIDSIKAEREKTANALKRYEEELERRKHEIPLGVPIQLKEGIEEGFYLQPALFVSCGNIGAGSFLDKSLGVFHSKESAEKHAEMLLTWRKALVANSKGEQLDIKALLPLLKKGWVAMDEDRRWWWYSKRPTQAFDEWAGTGHSLSSFNFKPAEDWRNSLIESGL